MTTSYFEIGGELIECITAPPSSERPGPSVVRRIAQQPRKGRRGTAVGRKSEKGYDFEKIVEQGFEDFGSTRRAMRAARAARAISVASALAVADGPLPVGDVLAVTLLSAYAGWEIANIIKG